MAANTNVSEQGLRELLLAPSDVWARQFESREMGGIALMGAAFSHFADQEYDRSIFFEEDAKHMVQTLLMTGSEGGMNGALLSINGQGKSLFNEQAALVVSGIGPKNVALVPHSAELTGSQLLGSKEAYKTRTVEDGKQTETFLSGEQIGIINPNTRAVIFDEFDYTSTEAVNAARTFLQKGSIEVNTEFGPAWLEPMDLVLASFNQYGSVHGNILEWATMSRIALGVEMGRDETKVVQKKIQEHDQVRERRANTINPIISDNNIRFMRRLVPSVKLANTPRTRIPLLFNMMLNNMSQTLRENGIAMGLPRLTDQLNLASKATALRNGRTEVYSTDVFEIGDWMLTAKLGCLGVGNPLGTSEERDSIRGIVDASLDRLNEDYREALAA